MRREVVASGAPLRTCEAGLKRVFTDSLFSSLGIFDGAFEAAPFFGFASAVAEVGDVNNNKKDDSDERKNATNDYEARVFSKFQIE